MEISQSTDPCTSTAAGAPLFPPGQRVRPGHGAERGQGLEAVDILRRGVGDVVGPVLHDDGCDTLGFLVPSGTAAAWDVPGEYVYADGREGVETGPLLPSGDADLATDPVVLRAALGEAARLIEAVD
ncbi:hypothetical protein SALBM311S_12170 [Streptomyces alboniger]